MNLGHLEKKVSKNKKKLKILRKGWLEKDILELSLRELKISEQESQPKLKMAAWNCNFEQKGFKVNQKSSNILRFEVHLANFEWMSPSKEKSLRRKQVNQAGYRAPRTERGKRRRSFYIIYTITVCLRTSLSLKTFNI